ncbi:uncharacterized protein [Panulirus ornatus]|uniref:uncharacterized protein isoform X1 n=1 Tax=Panulirus ornatus TaxID=150431 RepID=UPI003A87A1C4
MSVNQELSTSHMSVRCIQQSTCQFVRCIQQATSVIQLGVFDRPHLPLSQVCSASHMSSQVCSATYIIQSIRCIQQATFVGYSGVFSKPHVSHSGVISKPHPSLRQMWQTSYIYQSVRCVQQTISLSVSQECLTGHVCQSFRYPLQIVGHRGNKVSLSAAYDDKEQLHLQVKLPPGVTCDQCVLQMTNIADQFKPKKVMFRNCADIAILGNAKTHMAGGPPKHFHFAPRHGPVPIVQQEHRFFKKFS